MTEEIESGSMVNTLDNTSTRDNVFDMFLDEDFVPQAYVDILLSNIDTDSLHQLQALSSGLLTKLDFYTRSLANELETSIWNLEKLSETLPGTWSASSSRDYLTDDNSEKTDNEKSVPAMSSSSYLVDQREVGGVSKLEYYLDTLGTSVKSLESDLNKVEVELTELNERNGDDQDKSRQVVKNLKDLKLIKTRLCEVLTIFTTLRDIMVISDADVTQKKSAEAIRTFSFDDFKLSLSTLQETIEQTLEKSSREEDSSTVNNNFLLKIEQFAKLTPVFKGLDRFHDEYERFAKAILQSSSKYLQEMENVD